MTGHLETALMALELGLSPVPPRDDGTKAPLADIRVNDQWTWAPYQSTPATEEHVRHWYKNGRTGNGLACGVGGLECFEFDCRDTYEAFLEAAVEAGLGDLVERVRKGYEEFTPGGGVHWLYRSPKSRGNTKLAERPDPVFTNKRKPLIETRGAGGFIVTAPSNGTVHPSGGAYVLVSGGLDRMAALDPGELDELDELARTFDEMAKEPDADPEHDSFSATVPGKYVGYPKQGKRPGNDFADRTPWENLLEPHGWVKVFTRGDISYWRRPDKDRGVSATTGHGKGFKVFTTSTSLKTEGTHSKLGVLVALNYGGDYKAAVKSLAEKGYGTWIDDDGKERQNPVSKEWFEKRRKEPSGSPAAARANTGGAPDRETIDYATLSDEELGVEWVSDIEDEAVEWVNEGRLAIGKLHITAGAGGLGKSQYAIAEAAAISSGGKFPDGGECLRKGYVFILAAEDGKRDTIKPRLRAAGADMSRVAILKTKLTIIAKDGKPLIDFVNFQNLAYWEGLFKKHKPVLLIADPIPAFMGPNVNDHRNNDVRNVLEPFVDLLGHHGVAMEAISHVGKSIKDKSATDQVLGSVAYVNLARRVNIAWLDPKTPGRYVLTNPKLSVGKKQPAIGYTIEEFTYPKGDKTIVTSRSKFEDGTFEADENELRLGQKEAQPAANASGERSTRGRKPSEESIELAKWALGYLRNELAPIPKGRLFDEAGALDKLGDYGPDNRGKLSWKEGYRLSRAIDRVRHLDGDDAGWMIEETTMDGRKYLRAIHAHAGTDSGNSACPLEEDTQGVPF